MDFNKIKTMLEEAGAVLVRDRKHLVYRLPNGKNFVISRTPSDGHAAYNAKRVLIKCLAEKP